MYKHAVNNIQVCRCRNCTVKMKMKFTSKLSLTTPVRGQILRSTTNGLEKYVRITKLLQHSAVGMGGMNDNTIHDNIIHMLLGDIVYSSLCVCVCACYEKRKGLDKMIFKNLDFRVYGLWIEYHSISITF